MFKILAILIPFLIFSQALYAEEAGYREALEYFIYRKNQRQKEQGNSVQKVEVQQGLQEYLPEAYKFFLGVGAGENLELGFHSVEIGATVLAGEYLQQSVSLEYNRISTEESEALKTGAIVNQFATGVFLNHSI